MKLKGEKELLAEDLYMSVEQEYLGRVIYIHRQLLVNDKLGDLTEYSKNIEILNTTYRLVSAIYGADFSIFEIKAMCKLSAINQLLTTLTKLISKQLDKVNINNNDDVEAFIKTAMALSALAEENTET